MAIRMFKSIEAVDVHLGILDYTWFAKESIAVQLDRQSTSFNSASIALHSARVRNRTEITRASSFIHCAFGLEKEFVQVGVEYLDRFSVPPQNATDPPTCIRLFSEETSTRFDCHVAVFKIWILLRDSQ